MFELKYVKFFPDEPFNNVLVFVSTIGTTLEYPVSLGVSKHCIYLEGRLYDCWGREIIFDSKINRLIENISRPNALTPTYIVKLENGNFAIAKTQYPPIRPCGALADYPETKCPFSVYDKKEPVNGPILTTAESWEYSKIDNDFFVDTPIGQVLERFGIKILVAQIAESGKTVFLQNTGGRIITQHTTKSGAFHRVSHEFNGLCVFESTPLFNKSGDKLICKTDAKNLRWRGFDISVSELRSIKIELSAIKLEKYLEAKFETDSNYLDLPFKLISINPEH